MAKGNEMKGYEALVALYHGHTLTRVVSGIKSLDGYSTWGRFPIYIESKGGKIYRSTDDEEGCFEVNEDYVKERTWRIYNKPKEAVSESSIYFSALEAFGEEAQIRQFAEEAGELFKALNKRLKGADNLVDIVEEIVDVEIMLEQIKCMTTLDKRAYEEVKKTKLNKLLQKIGA